MNPFNELEELTEISNINTVEVWVEQFGRKKNTYVSGWNIPDKDLKDHIKIIKKSNGCNGSLKNNIIQFQGDITNYIKSYLIENNINIDNIRIRNYI